MLLNSKTVQDIIKSSEFTNNTQIGVDLSVCKIEEIIEGGSVFKKGTVISKDSYVFVPPTTSIRGNDAPVDGWLLKPGTYALEFNEGIELPENVSGFIIQRSSLYRMGNTICSPVWDPGFKTETMGTTLIVNNTMFIEKNACVAQFFAHYNLEVKETYNGQWQDIANYKEEK